MKTEKDIKGFEETRNCYFCKHFFQEEKPVKGGYEYRNFCKLNKALLKKIGWCPDFEVKK